MRKIRTLVVLLLFAIAKSASAQVAYHLSLTPGTQVRIETNQQPGRKIAGEVYGVARDTLRLGGDAAGYYAVSDLRKLEIRTGIARKRGMLIGTIVGGAIGFLEGTEERFSVTVGTALIGTLVGFAFAPKGWEKIPLPAR